MFAEFGAHEFGISLRLVPGASREAPFYTGFLLSPPSSNTATGHQELWEWCN